MPLFSGAKKGQLGVQKGNKKHWGKKGVKRGIKG
jgi:hypothetical protein